MGKHSSSMESMHPLLLFASFIQIVHGSICYTRKISDTSYRVIDSATVETQRGCEVFCDATTECTAFAFTPRGLQSWCALLEIAHTINTCIAPKEVFLKKTEGCLDRDNITAEFGDDPCIDDIVPSAYRPQGAPICEKTADKQLIIRAVTADGKRVTLDNDRLNRLVPQNGMWTFSFDDGAGFQLQVPVVAAVCASAGSAKCGCAPLPLLPVSEAVPAQIDTLGPCADPTHRLHVTGAKCNNPSACNYIGRWSATDIKCATIKCQAGAWMIRMDGTSQCANQCETSAFAVTALACAP